MKVVISGGSGFVGSNLAGYFRRKGNEVVALGRDYFGGDVPGERLRLAMRGVDVVINLAGAPINHRWSRSYRKKMYESRIHTTRQLVELVNGMERKPQVFISASAVGYYPTQGCYDEASAVKGDGFLADLCRAWEEEAAKVSPQVRLAITRFGVVLSKKGGAFPLLSLPAKFKVATVIGPGSQLLPWIYIGDLVRAMEHIATHPSLSGAVNFVSPGRVTNRGLTRGVARRERSWMMVKVPQLFFRLVLGEASTFLTTGQCVVPGKLMASGFVFQASTVGRLLDVLYGRE